MRRAPTVLAVLAAGLLFIAGCGDDDEPERAGTSTTTSPRGEALPPATAPPSPRPLLPLGELEPVIGGLSVPWEVAFVDASTFLVTERTGVVRVVEGGRLRPEPVLELDAVARGEGGVLGMALHPDFPSRRLAYVYYTAADGNRVSRFSVADDLTMIGEEVLLDGIPAAANHDGGRIAFGPDGHLYVATGDAGRPPLAADRSSLAGKVLRITADGGVPAGNPFDGSPVWSYGHRNPQGLAWAADGAMYATEHGPSGDLGLRANDEVNRIEAGGFYGWPFVAGITETGQGRPPAEPIPPLATSGPDTTWAPSGLAVVAGEDGEVLLFAALRGEALYRMDVDGGPPEPVIGGLGRLRIATLGPDGCLYVGTSNTDGRGDPGPDDDRILRTC